MDKHKKRSVTEALAESSPTYGEYHAVESIVWGNTQTAKERKRGKDVGAIIVCTLKETLQEWMLVVTPTMEPPSVEMT